MNTVYETELSKEKLNYLELLSKSYPTINAASTRIINLQAILNLPKGTEHYVSDVHGEYESFSHVLKNASGVIKGYITEIFGNSLRDSEKKSLATLIYYPDQKLESIRQKESDIADWYKITMYRLILVCRRVSNKYTRSKVRKALPPEFANILEELINESDSAKEEYYNEIIDTIIRLDRAEDIITAMARLIQRLAIDRLHVIGDIFDRGPGADKILDILINYHSVDIQWGNHDILWMGAASGGEACICNVIRISARYNNLHTIEEGYGINLVPLATFAMEHYGDDPCTAFRPEVLNKKDLSEKELELIAKMHKAICILQFKIEAGVILRHDEFKMQDRLLLDKIDYEAGTVVVDGKIYELCDVNFPTVDYSNPFLLTEDEEELIKKLKNSFVHSQKLQEHARFLFNKGSMYLVSNSKLLFHGCIPLNDDGSFKELLLGDNKYFGKEYLDEAELLVREAFFSRKSPSAINGLDLMWDLWCGSDSPLYGKDKMATFERYFIGDADACEEVKDVYYHFRGREDVCDRILADFGLDPESSHIINGHVPVRVSKGESPIKAGGKLLVIDGGFAKAYQSITGIAGYTLIYRSKGLILVSHEPFESTEEAIIHEKDILSSNYQVEYTQFRKKVEDTDDGREHKRAINDLELLLYAYRKGLLKEQR